MLKLNYETPPKGSGPRPVFRMVDGTLEARGDVFVLFGIGLFAVGFVVLLFLLK